MEPSEMDSLIFSGRNQGTPVLEARPLEDLRVVLTALCDSGWCRQPFVTQGLTGVRPGSSPFRRPQGTAQEIFS